MLTKITGRHMEVTDAMRSYVEKKVDKLHKYYNRISETDVTIDSEGQTHKVEIICKADNTHQFVAQQSNEDLYAAIDAGVDKIERQLIRHKEKSRSRKGRQGTAEASVKMLESQPESEEAAES